MSTKFEKKSTRIVGTQLTRSLKLQVSNGIPVSGFWPWIWTWDAYDLRGDITRLDGVRLQDEITWHTCLAFLQKNIFFKNPTGCQNQSMNSHCSRSVFSRNDSDRAVNAFVISQRTWLRCAFSLKFISYYYVLKKIIFGPHQLQKLKQYLRNNPRG